MKATPVNALVACEISGRVRDALRERGINAWSVDLLGPESYWDHPDPKISGQWRKLWQAQKWPNCHLEGDARWFLNGNSGPVSHWDMLIAFPPCTYLANSGIRWLYRGGRGKVRDPDRWKLMDQACEFFVELLEAPIERIAIENPRQHIYAERLIRHPYAQEIQPWQFGHGETKATRLWLKNLPPLRPTSIVAGREPRSHHASPGLLRWLDRSITLPGIAEAMAAQWGQL